MRILAIGALSCAFTDSQATDSSPESTPAATAQESAFDKSIAAGRATVKNESWQAAITAFSEAVKLDAKSADAHNLLGYSHRKQATPNLTKAFEHYGVALKLDPKQRGANEYIGKAYLLNKQPDMAAKHLANLETICGKTCPEYQDLAKAVAAYKP